MQQSNKYYHCSGPTSVAYLYSFSGNSWSAHFLRRVLQTVFQTVAHLDDLLLTRGLGAQHVRGLSFRSTCRQHFTHSSYFRHLAITYLTYAGTALRRGGSMRMRTYLFGLAVTLALVIGTPAAPAQNQNNQGQNNQGEEDRVPRLDHVFVIVLENHNSFTSFGSNGIIGNPQAPNITALWNKYNIATNYNAVWHPSLPNYVSMITGNWIGTDVVATGHSYPAGSTVGISDDDSTSVSTDYPSPPANISIHRWRVEIPSLAGQLVKAGKDWRAYLQNIPESGTHLANWPGDNNTAKLYAVKHNPFPYIAEIQDDPKQFAKQVPLEQLFGDLGSEQVPALAYIVPDQCRDMHGLSNPLAPCGGASDTDDNDVKRGDDMTGWLVDGIMGQQGMGAGPQCDLYRVR